VLRSRPVADGEHDPGRMVGDSETIPVRFGSSSNVGGHYAVSACPSCGLESGGHEPKATLTRYAALWRSLDEILAIPGASLHQPVSHFSAAYSALACLRMAMSGSATFQKVRKSWYAAHDDSVRRVHAAPAGSLTCLPDSDSPYGGPVQPRKNRKSHGSSWSLQRAREGEPCPGTQRGSTCPGLALCDPLPDCNTDWQVGPSVTAGFHRLRVRGRGFLLLR
jgi:hypothetical protein